MSFKGKLERLGSAPPGAAQEPPAASARGDVLASLRRKMAEILDQPPPVPAPPADPSRTALPFTREATAAGMLHRRRLVLPRSYHVGRVPVDAAFSAAPELLALLALDTKLGACRSPRALFLDTETTGLGSGGGVWAFLVGMAAFDAEGHLEVEQLLLQSPADEAALVERVSERVAACDFVVSYNGKTFDFPLLASRTVMCRLPPLPVRPHLDLLHVARRLHRARLGACRLVTLESEVLGFVRGPDIEGGEIPARYAHFLRTGDETALASVVEHNAWDVASMAALVGLYGEPFELLHPTDLLGMARTLKRAGAFSEAERAADTALDRGAGPEALRVRGSIAKARGERARALADFEAFSAEASDPAVRLELAKLYEHFLKVPARALEVLDQGTGESAEAEARRRTRLTRKAERSR
ncbi:MAG TPA: ribonuclease H-like domain-containing protein [Polyangiaceae bacterium]|nr:ribonuclease H-like domain-containing protein [Polyangiaceae bacterium]